MRYPQLYIALLCLIAVPCLFAQTEEGAEPPAVLTDIPTSAEVQPGQEQAPVFTSLLQAVAAKNIYASLVLIEKGAADNETDETGKNALLLAAGSNMPAVVDLLIEKGDNLLAKDALGNTALHLAARANDVYTTAMLLDKGIPIESLNERIYAPLLEAADAGSLDTCRFLVEKGESPLTSYDEETYFSAFHAAAKNHRWDVTALFREMGYRPDVFQDAALGDLPRLQKYADEDPAQFSLVSRTGMTPLIASMASNSPEAVEIILKTGIRQTSNLEGETPAVLAVKAGRQDYLALFFKYGASPDGRDGGFYGWTLLAHATMTEDLEMMDFLLRNGAHIGYLSAKGEAPIHVAAARNLESALRFLLERGAIVDTRSGAAQTPLHLAAEKNNTVFAELLLANGAKIQATDKRRWTPLHIAADAGNEAMIRLLLANNADVNAQDKQGRTPLNLATAKGNHAIAALLLESGTDPDLSDQKEQTPLHRAAALGDMQLSKTLLDSNAIVDSTDVTGKTPLFVALEEDHYELARMLAEAGASLGIKDNEGATLLFPAASNENDSAVRWLVGQQLDVNAVDEEGTTPLHVAARFGCEDSIKFLVAQGASVNAADKDGCTPLHLAAARGHMMNINALLDKGADMRARDHQGWLPLHYSAAKGHWGPLQLFILRGIPVNEPANDGNTALHLIVQGGFHRTASLLLTRGADFTARNAAGETPMDLIKKAREDYEARNDLSSLEKATRVALAQTQVFFQAVLLDELSNAVERKDKAFLQSFLDSYPELVNGSLFGRSVLYRAVTGGDVPVVTLLLERGADPNVPAVTKNKSTPLHLAAERSNKELIELLLKAGADVDQPDAVGVTPLAVARRIGRTDIIDRMSEFSGKQGKTLQEGAAAEQK
jgi:ankyrin repeat protein